MPTLAVTNFNIVCAVLGGFISLFGLVSYLFKEQFYLSEALISLLAGVAFSPNAANFIRPLEYAQGSQASLEAITLYFTRLVLGVQLIIAGVQLPTRYLLKEWRSLSLLIGPGMTGMWLCTSLIIWAFVPHIPFLHALAVAACVTPTDPILSNSIVKGKFADNNIPRPLQSIIVAESGANDGLGYPFLFFALYLIRYTGHGALGQTGGVQKAMTLWFGEIWGYTILLSIVYGVVVGWLAKELLHWAEKNRYIDRESFLVFAIALALFIVGTCGMIGSDDVLACFIAGNVFTIDDWFRVETMDDSLQPTIDMLLNLSIFMWFGAVCPWSKFIDNNVIPFHKLLPLGILVLVFRRIPVVFAMHKHIRQIEEFRQAAFVGFFGPIGVSAIFYLYITLEYLEHHIKVDGEIREDAKHLGEVVHIVVWFMTICSIIVHGLSIPLAKLVFYLPRTLSISLSMSTDPDPEPINFPFRQSLAAFASRMLPPSIRGRASSKQDGKTTSRERSQPPKPVVFRIGRPVISNNDSNSAAPGGKIAHECPLPPAAPLTASSPLLGISLPIRDPSRCSNDCDIENEALNSSQAVNGYGALDETPTLPRIVVCQGDYDISNVVTSK
ncbi:hypothetical protein LOZ53_004096 [Ophidiomyces ophidiicola]|nr:hypothetical protein LOZ55_005478 [Ophidiomyces ophidiicola]KAI1987998.1 hypothetical protein LOZ53_004096 [Ophidiomyces ophidiicola]KAI1989146.1 hypothetical protein LOZ54_002967 [Ophidiomyces ophidiicola]KAI1989825.1 hypothetical protein LOZ51_005070 [Ophidiomyces ophidiicola]